MSVSDVVKEDTYDSWTWPETIEEESDQVSSSYSSFRAEPKFFAAGFLPPPPRPPYLEDRITSDGLTTCDLCSWALRQYSESKTTYSADVGFIFSQNLFITLTVVSILSALLGAVIMIVVLNCKSRFSSTGSHRTFFCLGRRRYGSRRDTVGENNVSLESHKEIDDQPPPSRRCKTRSSWLMLNRLRRTTPVQMLSTSANTTPVGNHYTVEETYTSINEAVYTELNNAAAATPVYQNCGYMLEVEVEGEAISSAPSSAYYSDISGQGTYEMIGQTGNWNSESRILRRPANVRYSSADESVSVHSNYI